MTYKEPLTTTTQPGLITLAGDLAGTATTPNVVNITGAAGVVTVAATGTHYLGYRHYCARHRPGYPDQRRRLLSSIYRIIHQSRQETRQTLQILSLQHSILEIL